MSTFDLKIDIDLAFLWGDTHFKKHEWGFVNFLVGPNGTGKTLVAERIKEQAAQQGLTPRYLNAERLSGLERQNYGNFTSSQLEPGFQIPNLSNYKAQAIQFGLGSSAYVVLKEKLDLRIRIEATLSQLFGRNLRLSQDTGFLKPTLRRRNSDEYDLKKAECHGLKQLIPLLTFLYDDDNDCLIIDEPELHLHPQYQAFFLQQVRNMAGDPRTEVGKKCFFLITHSPYFLDLRTPEDLRHCVVFHPDGPPTWINEYAEEDLYRVKRLLPRLNTHHKQFFFATRPIFVEGHTDQQLFAIIQERRGKILGAAGACFIDVTGKDELDLFFRLCKRLKIDGQFIADFDSLLGGKLRQTVAADERCRQFLQQEGMKIEPMEAIGEVERELGTLATAIQSALEASDELDAEMRQLLTAMQNADKVADEGAKQKRKRLIALMGVMTRQEGLTKLISGHDDRIGFIKGRVAKLIDAFRQCNVFVLAHGELEHYLPSYTGNSYENTEKLRTFETERDYLLNNSPSKAEMQERYGELLNILDAASSANVIDFDAQINQHVQDWIYKVQSAYQRRHILDAEMLQKDMGVEWESYSRLFELLEFSATGNGFRCRVRLNPIVDQNQREIEFDHETMPSQFRLPTVAPALE